jgi:hypothetical protein
MPAWKESNQSGMRYVGAFYFPSTTGQCKQQRICVSWVALDVYIFWVLDGWKRGDGARAVCTQSRVTSATPAGRLIMSGWAGYFVTSQERLLFISHWKLAINYIFILLLGAIKGIFVNRKILVFQITCDVFSPAARGQRNKAKERYRLGKINTTKLYTPRWSAVPG